MPILQGSNAPLIVKCDKDVSDLSKIVLSLWVQTGNKGGKLLKKWEKDDVQINENIIMCPLKEEETASFPDGSITLSVKGLDTNNQVRMWDEITVKSKARLDSIFHITEV